MDEHKILLTVTARIKARMELVRAIIAINHPTRRTASWDAVVQWLVDTVPIPELLADLCRSASDPGTQG